MTHRIEMPLPSFDVENGGAYQITGTVTELGSPGRYPTFLFQRSTKRCLRETLSAADGAYAFTGLKYVPNGYFAIAYDYGVNPLNAAIADLITPEPMP
jgi:hypothetical protein